MTVIQCPFCGVPLNGASTNCYACGAPISADPNQSLTEKELGPISSLFMLNATNRATAMGLSRKVGGVTGNTNAVTQFGCGVIALVGFFLLMLKVVSLFVVSSVVTSLLTLLVLIAVVAFSIISIRSLSLRNEWTNYWRNQRLMREGHLLRGEIAKSWFTYRRSGHASVPVVNLTYTFNSPTGKAITGEDKQSVFAKTFYTVLPPVGTPVAVMYADDSCHKVL